MRSLNFSLQLYHWCKAGANTVSNLMTKKNFDSICTKKAYMRVNLPPSLIRLFFASIANYSGSLSLFADCCRSTHLRSKDHAVQNTNTYDTGNFLKFIMKRGGIWQ